MWACLYDPFPCCGARKGTAMVEFSRLVWLAMKLIVAQFCRVKDHESMKVQSVSGRKIQSSFHTNCRRAANRFVGVSLASR